MTQNMKKGPILEMGSDKMILRHVYDKPFMIRFPERSEWKEEFQPNRKKPNLVYRWFHDKQGHLSWGVLLWNKAEIKFRPWAAYNSIPGRSVCHKGMHS
jgi:hypothetical protein